MKKELEFLEQLKKLQNKAEENHRKISKEEVKMFFEGDDLTEAQFEFVYEYLASQGIRVDGFEEKKEEPKEQVRLTIEEQNYLKMYEEDLLAIRAAAEGEKEELLKLLYEGDTLSKGRMTEIYLPLVVELAKDMYDGTVDIGDMIQEGNVNLMLALETCATEETATVLALEELLEEEIRSAIRALLAEQQDMKQRDQILVQKVNNLDTSVQDLKKDMGREITMEELSEHLKISDEEIFNIMKLAGENLEE